MTQALEDRIEPRPVRIEILEPGKRSRRGWLPCRIGSNIEFSTERLETYCLAKWDPVVFDTLLVAASIEFADRLQHRPMRKWSRCFELSIPVHDPKRWNMEQVRAALREAVGFLTGDTWQFHFEARRVPVDSPRQARFVIPDAAAIIPFSDGLDSRIVAALMERELGDSLIRVRLGARNVRDLHHPFTSVPYSVKPSRHSFPESSARSRGFKFAVVSGLAAYLSGAKQIVVPESGQGALGPALVTVGQAYEDYRSHPLFTTRMENLFSILLGVKLQFVFPRLWSTKGETLGQFVSTFGDVAMWSDTWSCWQQSRQVSVEGKKRQCGVCAACMLRRMSVHAAGLTEKASTYVWEDLSANTLRNGAAKSFPSQKITKKLHQYAIAGTLHLDHLAGVLDSPANLGVIDLTVFQLSKAMQLSESDTQRNLKRLLVQHRREWAAFLQTLGRTSFVADWAVAR